MPLIDIIFGEENVFNQLTISYLVRSQILTTIPGIDLNGTRPHGMHTDPGPQSLTLVSLPSLASNPAMAALLLSAPNKPVESLHGPVISLLGASCRNHSVQMLPELGAPPISNLG